MEDPKKVAWRLHKNLKPLYRHLSFCAVLYAVRKSQREGMKQKDFEDMIRNLATLAKKRRKNRLLKRKALNDKSRERPAD